MAFATTITPVEVDNVFFSPAVKPPASNNQLFLAGAGIRGLEMEGVFVKFTAIGVYLEEEAAPILAGKWKGKTAHELTESVQFFRELVTGPFEKFVRVTLVNTLTGQQYSEKVAENCVAILKSLGVYSQAEAEAIAQMLHIFKDQHFPPSSSILFTLLRDGSLAITFGKEGVMPETENGVIQNKLLAEAVLESIIGKNGVSPKARSSIASRLAEVFVHSASVANGN